MTINNADLIARIQSQADLDPNTPGGAAANSALASMKDGKFSSTDAANVAAAGAGAACAAAPVIGVAMASICAAGARGMTIAIHDWASGAYAQRNRDYRAGQKLFNTYITAEAEAVGRLRDQYYQLFGVAEKSQVIHDHLQVALTSQGCVAPAIETSWDKQLPFWQRCIDVLPAAMVLVNAAYVNQAARLQQEKAAASASQKQASIEAMRASSSRMASASGAAAAKQYAASKKASAQRRVTTVLLVVAGAAVGSAAAYGVWRFAR
jgi:hypothetical protein